MSLSGFLYLDQEDVPFQCHTVAASHTSPRAARVMGWEASVTHMTW